MAAPDELKQADKIHGSHAPAGRLLTRTQQLIDVIGVVFIAVILMSVVAEVVSRYLFSSPLPWTDPAASHALAWLVFLGVSAAVWTNSNLGVSYFRMRVPWPAVQLALEVFASMATIVFGMLLAWSGYLIIGANRNASVGGLNLSYTVIYSVTVASGLLMILFAIGRIAVVVTERERLP